MKWTALGLIAGGSARAFIETGFVCVCVCARGARVCIQLKHMYTKTIIQILIMWRTVAFIRNEKKCFCLPFFSFNFTTQQPSTENQSRTKNKFKRQTNRLWTINFHCILYSSLFEQNRCKTISNQIWHQITSCAPNPSTPSHLSAHSCSAPSVLLLASNWICVKGRIC